MLRRPTQATPELPPSTKMRCAKRSENDDMRFRYLNSLLLAAAITSPLLNLGCAEHHYYRAYDPDHGEHHSWDNNEVVYYQQ